MINVNAIREYGMCYAYVAYALFLHIVNYVMGLIRKSPRSAPQNLTGKTVLITGASGGLGQSLAIRFAREGCNLALLDLNKADVQKVSAEVKLECPDAEITIKCYACDVTNASQVQQTLATVRSEVGTIDILCNNAGVALGKSFEDLTLTEIRKTFDVNVLSHFTLTKEVLSHMISNEYGHIVSTASVLGLYGFSPRCTDYAASKFAAVGFMEALEYDLHAKGVDCVGFTTVCPFMIKTPMFTGCVPSRFPNAMPILTPEYVADKTVEGVKNRSQCVVLPPDWVQFPILKLILPHSVMLKTADYAGVNTSMDSFVGRNGAAAANGVAANGNGHAHKGNTSRW